MIQSPIRDRDNRAALSHSKADEAKGGSKEEGKEVPGGGREAGGVEEVAEHQRQRVGGEEEDDVADLGVGVERGGGLNSLLGDTKHCCSSSLLLSGSNITQQWRI